MYDLIPLNLLSAGQIASVGCLTGAPEQVHRLEELGIRAGVQLEVLQGGSPCIIRIAGSKMCFRDCEALSVLVQVGEG